ncbi:MAG: M48 family metallopeptidase [Opitutae bacterium]|nr:M48 family metallopeptidase [Opitutae bacterium]
MDFFEAQDRARRRTKRLVFLFALAVLGTIAAGYVAAIFLLGQTGAAARRGRQAQYDYYEPPAAQSWWNPQVFAGVALGTVAIVGLASLFKWAQFRGGGSAVAESVGARRVDPHTTQLHERRLLNVVEEMAIASGVPMPAVYIMDDEPALNAFAAGLTTSDAAVCVTRGTLEKLTRDELQGVIGHEFSHILNGDMRLNVKLTAIVFGILVIGLLGRGILQSLGRGRVRVGGGGKNKGGGLAVIIAIGLALLLIGYIGYFFGRLIQAAVSRQREFLADASAVQFTRNPLGLTGALKKIGGLALGSSLDNSHAAELGHFFFAQGFRSMFGGLWATHPPLEERIRAVDAQWDGKFIEPPEVVDVRRESFSDAGLAPRRPAPLPLQPLAPAAAVALIGNLETNHVDYAQQLLARVPPQLRDAARSATDAPALVYALLLDADPAHRDRQFAALGSTTGADALQRTRELFGATAALPPEARLPLVSLTLPALRNLPATALDAFTRACDTLIMTDGEVSVFEFMIQKALIRHVVVARQPQQHANPQIFSFQAVAAEIALILSVLASASSDDADVQSAAFAAGAAQLPLLANHLAFQSGESWDFHLLDAALDKLASASGPIKQRALLAAAHVVSHDGVILAAEAELLRAVADTLDCPMPPLQAAA